MKNQIFQIAIAASILLTFAAGCSVQPESVERSAVFKDLKEVGFLFDDTLIYVNPGSIPLERIVSGPIIGPKKIDGPVGAWGKTKVSTNDRWSQPDSTYTRYSEVIVKIENGKWTVVKAAIRR